jgi:hypothetical protein
LKVNNNKLEDDFFKLLYESSNRLSLILMTEIPKIDDSDPRKRNWLFSCEEEILKMIIKYCGHKKFISCAWSCSFAFGKIGFQQDGTCDPMKKYREESGIEY